MLIDMPPPQYDHIPYHAKAANPIYRLVVADDLKWHCMTDIGFVALNQKVYACSGWKDGRLYIYLPKDAPARIQQALARHELGHENELEATGDPNVWHVGWTTYNFNN